MTASRFVVRLTALCRPLASHRLLAGAAIVALGAFVGPAATPARAQVGPPDAFYHTGGALGEVLVTEDQVLVTRGPRVVAFDREPGGLGAELGASERLAGPPLAMARHGDLLLVSTIGAALDILEIDPSGPPRLRHRLDLKETTSGLAVDGDRAYLVGNHWLAIVDLARDPPVAEMVPLDATSTAQLDDLPHRRRLVVAGGRLVFNGFRRGGWSQGLHVAEILPGPRVRTVATLPIQVLDLVAFGEHVFAIDEGGLGNYPDAIVAIDVSAGTAPREMGRWVEDPGDRGSGSFTDLFVTDGRLGVATSLGLHVLDVADPAAIRPVARDEHRARWCDALYGQVIAEEGRLLVAACEVTLSVATLPEGDVAATPTWVATVRLGDVIRDVAFGEGFVAVARGRDVQLLAVDDSGGAREIAATAEPFYADALAIGGGRLWIVEDEGLSVAPIGAGPLVPQPVTLDESTMDLWYSPAVAATRTGAVVVANERLLVVDASAGAPQFVAALAPELGMIDELVAHGNRVYAGSAEGLAIVDLADPARPTILAAARHELGRGLATDGRTVWRQVGLDLLAFDVSDPTHGLPETRYRVPFSISGLAVHDGSLLVVRREGFRVAVQAFDPTTPRILRQGPSLVLPLFNGFAGSVLVDGDTLIGSSRLDGLIVAPAPFAAPRHAIFVPVAHGAGD